MVWHWVSFLFLQLLSLRMVGGGVTEIWRETCTLTGLKKWRKEMEVTTAAGKWGGEILGENWTEGIPNTVYKFGPNLYRPWSMHAWSRDLRSQTLRWHSHRVWLHFPVGVPGTWPLNSGCGALTPKLPGMMFSSSASPDNGTLKGLSGGAWSQCQMRISKKCFVLFGYNVL